MQAAAPSGTRPESLIAEAVASGRLKATQDGGSVIPTADISLICVGTPSAADGGPNLTYVRSVASEIGTALRTSGRRHTVVVRSTLFPAPPGAPCASFSNSIPAVRPAKISASP